MKQTEEVGFAAVLFVIFAVFVGLGWGYNATARIVPLTVSVPGLAISAIHLTRLALRWRSAAARAASPETGRELLEAVDAEPGQADEPGPFLTPRTRKMLGMWAWIIVLAAGIDLLGFLAATPCFLLGFIRFFAKRSWAQSVTIAAAFTVCMYLIFYVGLKAQL
ncbi:MAG TPA: tripartite tricarboxylate transporter TctB family protein [Deferrisomatales bacterium]|nr:tripartite tricarboxylate transporter TctB family protein [Deferrisomatales bacterium]